MSIPKKIHYCWFGHNPKPASVKHCIQTWKKHNPDYEIIEWNEDNFDLDSCPGYVKDAYTHQKWAFVTDYARLRIIYENGGVYLDTDVEMLKNLDFLLPWHAYFGFEDGHYINTGLGYGAEKGSGILKEIMDSYEGLTFENPDGSLNLVGCPKLNTNIFLNHGLECNDREQILDGNIRILPSECLCPMDYDTRIIKKTKETISIHYFAGTWVPEEEMEEYKTRVRQKRQYKAREAVVEAAKKLIGERLWGVLKKTKRRLWK